MPSLVFRQKNLYDSDSDSESEASYANDLDEIDIDKMIDQQQYRVEQVQSISDLIHGRRPKKAPKVTDLQPIVYVRFNTRPKNAKPKPVTLKALVDSGGSATLVTAKYAAKLKKYTGMKTVWSTPAGSMNTTQQVRAQFTMPELHDNRMIQWNVHVTKDLGNYDMIIGRDLISDLKMEINFNDNILVWDEHSIPLKDRDAPMKDAYHINEPEATQSASTRLKEILDAKYDAADLEQVCKECTHLNENEQRMLLSLLQRYEELFDGTLGTWKGEPYNIDLKPDVTPYHARAFPIPRIHLQTLKTEVERLCEAKVLKRVNRSEWAAPTFVIPKKDGTVRFISDFRELNKRIKRHPYPIPKIQDMLLNLEGFMYATSLDLNMGYYHIELNPTSKRYCTIVLPFGKFEYQRLPMGLCNSPDIFQEKISDLMVGLEYVRAYIDDLLVNTCASFEDHLKKLEEVFKRLKAVGLKVNAKKSFFARGEVEYLGYWITRDGIQPLDSKVQAMMNIAEPTTKKELRSFIGLVNYYRDMWVKRSHLLAPLASLTSKTTKWKWGPEQAEAFREIKKVISRKVLLAYPDFNEPFIIHTDASHYQLGAVISQNDKPIAFYSRKLKPEQTRYTTTERELLSIVETLKEFRNILLGHSIVVYTDHKNLTCKTFNTERVMRWRLILEEYGPELRYIKGEDNTVADALSRLNIHGNNGEPKSLHKDPEAMAEAFAFDDDDIEITKDTFPMSYAVILQEQNKDEVLKKRVRDNPTSYETKTFKVGRHEYNLYTWNDRIVIPTTLQEPLTTWYHERLMHPGETRTELTIAQHFYWKGMRNTVKRLCARCLPCKLNKPATGKHGYIPPKKEAEVEPWKTLCIDLIGTYKFGSVKKGTYIELPYCLTMIDPATGWFEIAPLQNRESYTVASALEQTWLSRYPWPQEVVLDRGSEFMDYVKEMLKTDYGLKRKPITSRNPQANSMVERAHKTMHNLIRAQTVRGSHDLPEHDPFGGILTAVRFGMNSTVHTTNRATPTQLVFGRDAMHNTPFVADWQYIKERKQRIIHQNNKRENATRIPHTYRVNDKVMVRLQPNRKHGAPYSSGPYTIDRVNDNGTVELHRITQRGGVVSQTWNIRNLEPYGN